MSRGLLVRRLGRTAQFALRIGQRRLPDRARPPAESKSAFHLEKDQSDAEFVERHEAAEIRALKYWNMFMIPVLSAENSVFCVAVSRCN